MEVYAVYMYIILYTCQSHNSMPPQKNSCLGGKLPRPGNCADHPILQHPTVEAQCQLGLVRVKVMGSQTGNGLTNWDPWGLWVDLTLQTPSWIPNKKCIECGVTTVGSTESWILNPGGQQWLNWKDAVGFSVSIYISECFSFLWTTCHWHKVYHKVHLWIHCIVLKHFPWGGAKW